MKEIEEQLEEYLNMHGYEEEFLCDENMTTKGLSVSNLRVKGKNISGDLMGTADVEYDVYRRYYEGEKEMGTWFGAWYTPDEPEESIICNISFTVEQENGLPKWDTILIDRAKLRKLCHRRNS